MKRKNQMVSDLGGYSFTSQLGRQALALLGQIKDQHAMCARLHAFLYSRRLGAAHRKYGFFSYSQIIGALVVSGKFSGPAESQL
jgi:hypothetical protein